MSLPDASRAAAMATATEAVPAAAATASNNWVGEFVLLAALWGASFLFMRLGATELGALPTAGLRVGLATLFLWPLLLRQGLWPALRRHWQPIFVAGVVNSAIPFALYSWAVLHIDTGLSAILNASVPLFGALIAALWLGDRINRLRWYGLALGFAGVALLTLGSKGTQGVQDAQALWAAGACLLASFCYGVAASFTRKHLAGVPPLAIATGSQMGASLALALPTLWLWPAQAPSLRAVGAVAAMAVLCTGIAYILYFRLIANAGPSRALAVTFITPVFALIYGAILLGERITPWMVGCGLVIVCGTLLSTGLVRWPERRNPVQGG
jgi:drug/metabolite transporter (DMT)-like permease